jgi:hypothetical protein
VIDNGPPNTTSGNEMTEWIQAEDFTLGAGATITSVRFWAFSLGTGYNGSIVWQIYANNAGTPNVGSILASGTVTPVPLDLGAGTACCGADSLQIDFSTGGVALAAGTYWLGLHNGPLSHSPRDEFYWQTTAANGTLAGHEDITPFGDSFSSNGAEHAFQLFSGQAVPEPATSVLLGLGILALASLRVRRS